MSDEKIQWKAYFYTLLIAAALSVALFLWSGHDPDVARIFNIVKWPMVVLFLLAFLMNSVMYVYVRRDPVEEIEKIRKFLNKQGLNADRAVYETIDWKDRLYDVKMPDGQVVRVTIQRGKVVVI